MSCCERLTFSVLDNLACFFSSLSLSMGKKKDRYNVIMATAAIVFQVDIFLFTCALYFCLNFLWILYIFVNFCCCHVYYISIVPTLKVVYILKWFSVLARTSVFLKFLCMVYWFPHWSWRFPQRYCIAYSILLYIF